MEYVSLEELLSQSDIISLHCPLNPDTYHIIDTESLKHIKQGVMLINTSRGKLIDTEAVKVYLFSTIIADASTPLFFFFSIVIS